MCSYNLGRVRARCGCTYVRLALTCGINVLLTLAFINTHGVTNGDANANPTQIVNDITTMHGRACESSLCLELFREPCQAMIA